jgi:antitoxin HicB
MERSFPVVLVPQAEGGFFIECPALPGCYSQGETVEEALDNIREVILLTIEDMRELGQPIPELPAPLITEVRVSA